MSIQNPYSNYAKQGVMTASPGELTVMLYDGCIRFCRRAQMFIEEDNTQEVHNNILRAQQIVMELINTLDLNYKISDELLSIYEFLHRELIDANVYKDPEIIDGIVGIMTDLRDTWQQASKIARQNEYIANAADPEVEEEE